MYTQDIQEIENNSRDVIEKSKELLQKVETINDSGFDPQQSNKIAEHQEELLLELAQLVSNFNEILTRGEKVELNRPEYSPNLTSITKIRNTDTGDVTITWDDTQTPASDIKVLKNGNDITNFPDPISSGDTMEFNITDSDTVRIEIYGKLVNQNSVLIHDWADLSVTGSNPSLDVDITDVTVPKHSLVPQSKTFSTEFTK